MEHNQHYAYIKKVSCWVNLSFQQVLYHTFLQIQYNKRHTHSSKKVRGYYFVEKY